MKKQDHIETARRKLKGKWQSDSKKTMSRWVFPKRIAGARLKFWKSVFGKNEWRFTATRVYGDFEGRKSISRYRILWADEWSAVIAFERESGEKIHHLFFDEPWFYFLAGRDIVEYFRRAGD